MKHIFITGCPRSGTTMLASMLGNKSICVATPESDFFVDFIYKYLPKKTDSVQTSDYVEYLNNNYRFKQWNIDANNIKNLPEKVSFSNLNYLIENTVNLFATTHFKVSKNEFVRIDHTPSSIKNFYVLNELFPDSKFIFIIRDPRAVYASVKDLDWGANTPLRLSEIWNEYTNHYFSLEKLFPNRICLIRYEDILTNPILHIKKVCEFSKIDYDDSMLEATGFKIPGYTASQHRLVGKKLDLNRIEKWKNELKLEDILIIESKCRYNMNAFGYNISQDNNFRVGFKEKVKMIFIEMYFYIKNKIRKKKREKKA
ncbi:sulfotransferase family protein [Xanthomarina sp. GH4-25]|uniref:sulfotransferase family protein n=1 Tax=Xanthomarina sp. GH4-25 TaxID=3349335 RepID=UPI003877B2DF